jgi:hypothetical protein
MEMTIEDFLEMIRKHNELAAECDFTTAIDVFSHGSLYVLVMTPTDSIEPEAIVLGEDQLTQVLDALGKEEYPSLSMLYTVLRRLHLKFATKMTPA